MFKNYLKIAYRNLWKNKVYSVTNIVGLATSIACCILIFTLVTYHLSFDNFHKNPDRIYRFVTEQQRDQISYVPSVPPPLAKVFRTDYNLSEQVARSVLIRNPLISFNNGKEVKKFKEKDGAVYAEPGFFEIFNFPLLQGNIKTALTEPNTAVITEHLAKKYFGTENAINKVFRFENKADFKITGILKNIPTNTDQKQEIYLSWATLESQHEWFSNDDSWFGISTDLQCYAKLRPNVSAAQVEKLLPAYVTKFRPKSNSIHHYKLQPLSEVHFDGRYGGVMEKRNLWILSFIGLFLIITACVNFVNLATAQALKRAKEVGIRKVLGSMRWQLFWQFIAETAMITFVATVIAIGLSYLALPFVNDWFKTQMVIHVFSNPLLFGFLLILILVATFFAGSYPGFILSGFRPVAALKGKLSQQHIGGFNTRRTLIVTQFTISLVLIIGMIVITRQMNYAKNSDLGFNKDAVIMLPNGVDSANSSTKTLRNELAVIPGVQSVSQCYAAPASDETWTTSIEFDNRTEPEMFRTNIKAADEWYLKTFDLDLVAGRNLNASDTVHDFLVNEMMVKKLGLKSPEEAVGKKIIIGDDLSGTVTGVVKDFHDFSFHSDINPVAITTYGEQYSNYAVKIDLIKMRYVLPALEKKWSSFNPDKIYEYQFLDEQIAAFYETEETMLKLISVFSFIAIFIGCLGLYGLVSFMAAQKTKEIGIRKVLGSSVVEILWIFGKEFGGLIAIAFCIAAPIGWWLMNSWLQDFKYRISIGIGAFAIAIVIILFIAIATVAYQSIKAAMANPVKSLRTE